MEEVNDNYELRYLGEGSVPNFIQISANNQTFEIMTESPDSLGFYLFEYSGCNNENSLERIYLNFEIAENNAPFIREWEEE